jgi:hypothetical protein
MTGDTTGLHPIGHGIPERGAALELFETVIGLGRLLSEGAERFPLEVVARASVLSLAPGKGIVAVQPHEGARLGLMDSLAQLHRQGSRERDCLLFIEVVMGNLDPLRFDPRDHFLAIELPELLDRDHLVRNVLARYFLEEHLRTSVELPDCANGSGGKHE